MRKQMRRSRIRRGSRRLVRKNKTYKMMMGGDWNDSVPVTLDTYTKTGYKYAIDSLFNTSKQDYKLIKHASNPLIVKKIKADYKAYYDKTVNKQIPKFEPDDKSSNGVSKTNDTTELLKPEKFDECITYIAADDITRKTGPSTKGTNRQYVNFGKSFRRLTGENDDSIVGNLSSVAHGLFQNAMTSENGKKLAAGAQTALGDLSKNIQPSGNPLLDFAVKTGANNIGAATRLGIWGLGKVGPAKALELAKLASKSL